MDRPRYFILLGLVLSLALVTCAPAAAQPLSVEELTDHAALVVAGRVGTVSAQWDRQVNGIYTYVTVDVAEVWKGQLATRQLVLKLLGGRVGELELAIHGQARLIAGQDVALWLEVRPRDSTLYPAAFAQGVRELSDTATADALRAAVQSRPVYQPTPEFVAIPPEWHTLVGSSFTYGPEGGPARWHEAETLTRVFVDYQSPPTGLGGGVAEITNAVNLWNGSGMNLPLQVGVARNARCLATYENGSDGGITVSFNDACNELGPFGSTLGVGGGYFTDGEIRTVNNVDFKKFLQGAVMLSRSSQLSQRGCFQDAITHNLGHTIGLGDSDVAAAVMSVAYAGRCGATPSALHADDVAGARSIYPTGLPNATPGVPTNLTGSATGTTVNLSWTAPVHGGEVRTYVVEAGVAPAQPIISVATNSTATSVSFANVTPGFYYIRVRARNNFATGAPSNEIGLAVACAAPQPPTNLAFTAFANNVTLTWTPPASGPQLSSYLLVVGSAPGAGNLLTHQFAPTTSLAASGPAGTYYVRLHAQGVCGTSAASNEVVVTLPAPCVTPAAPQNFTHLVGANRVVQMSWTAPSTGTAPFTYTIEVGSATGQSNLLVSNLGGVTSVAVQAPPGTYFVRVRATNGCGTAGAASIERTVVVP